MTATHRKLRRIRRTVLAFESCEARVLMAIGPPLGGAASFAILGGSTVTNTGPSNIVGDVGVSPGTSITGFPPGVVSGGAIHAGDAPATLAEADTATAYGVLAGEPVDTILSGQNLGGMTLTPGVYHFATSAQLSGALSLDAQGDPNAVFVIQIGTTLTTATGSSVVLINSAHANNVFWQVGSSATLGLDTAFQGNVLAFTSITLNTGASISPGRALAINGGVTLDTNASSNVFTTPLTITANDQTSVFGAPLSPLTASYTGFVNGDTSASLTTQPTLTTTATAGSPAGPYAITANGAVDPYYTISYVSGTYTVTPAPQTIDGTVFLDLNASGVIAAGDPGMAGRVVFVDLHGDGTIHADDPQAVTDSSGHYTIGGLAPGLYTLRVTTFPNDDPTGPDGNQLALDMTAGQDVTGANFGLQPGSTVVPRTPTPTPFAGATTTQEAVIESLYRTILGRDGEPAGITHWVDRAQAGETYSAIATEFLQSTEYRTHVIESYYQTFLGRSAEPAGLASWLAAFGSGWTETQVAEYFVSSPEYTAEHSDNSDYVASLYSNLLGRDATQPEIDAWDLQLGAGLTRSALAVDTVESNEAYDRGIEGQYTAFLARVGEPAGIAHWLTLIQDGTMTLDGVEEYCFGCTEFLARAASSV